MATDLSLSKKMPYDVNVEQAVLGSIIINPKDCLEIVGGFLNPEDFYVEDHQKLFTILKGMADRNEVIDALTIIENLKESGIKTSLDPIQYLATITASVPQAQHIYEYAKVVKDKAILRKIIDTCSEVTDIAYSEECDVDEFIDQTEQRFFEIAQKKQTTEFQTIKMLLGQAYQDVVDRSNLDGAKIDTIKTGYSGLDTKLIELGKGNLIIVGARPAMGKTAFCINTALNVAKQGKTVCIFSLEMSALEIVNRMICCQGMVDSTAFKSGELQQEDWRRLTDAITILSDTPILIDDSSSINTLQMKAKLRRVPNLGLVIVDYLGLMQSVKKTDNRTQEVSDITRNLKILAKELNVPVICAAQLSRNTEQRGKTDRRPQLSDLRESGSIEQDADVVLFLYREGYYDNNGNFEDTADKNTAEVIISKNRHGSTGNVKMMWMPQYTKFVTMDRPQNAEQNA